MLGLWEAQVKRHLRLWQAPSTLATTIWKLEGKQIGMIRSENQISIGIIWIFGRIIRLDPSAIHALEHDEMTRTFHDTLKRYPKANSDELSRLDVIPLRFYYYIWLCERGAGTCRPTFESVTEIKKSEPTPKEPHTDIWSLWFAGFGHLWTYNQLGRIPVAIYR